MTGKDLISSIKEFNKDRDPEILVRKYAAMRESKYRFFRATAHLFYRDIPKSSFLFRAPAVWLCGDLHLENFGSYKGDNRVAYFNINDFDECILGSLLLDLARMMCSVYIAADSLGIPDKKAHLLNDVFIDTYFNNLKEGYIRVLEKETTTGIIRNFLEEIKNRKRKTFIKKRTVLTKGKIRLKMDPLHTAKINKRERKKVTEAFHAWAGTTKHPAFFKLKDMAFRIAGTSSLGLKRYILLVEGNGTPDENYLLDLKESRPSCLHKKIKIRQPEWISDSERIVEVQNRFISDPPALLHTLSIDDCDFVLKELQPLADRIDYTLFEKDIDKLEEILSQMGEICAWSNLRASGRDGSDIADELIAFAAKPGKTKQALKTYAYAYSQTVADYYETYCNAYDKGSFNLIKN